jgi:hypothetical protein
MNWRPARHERARAKPGRSSWMRGVVRYLNFADLTLDEAERMTLVADPAQDILAAGAAARP